MAKAAGVEKNRTHGTLSCSRALTTPIGTGAVVRGLTQDQTKKKKETEKALKKETLACLDRVHLLVRDKRTQLWARRH